MQARTQAVQVPPQHVWEGMAQYAPEAAELACHSLDIASAESYFARVSVHTCTLLALKIARRNSVLPSIIAWQAFARGCNGRDWALNGSADVSMYIVQPGAALRDAQQGAAQKTARLALTMAAAAAADSAAGTLHASTPQPNPQAAQGPLPLHTLAGLPTGQAAALPGSSAMPAARPVLGGPAQGLLGSMGMPQAMPASYGTAAAAAAQRPQQAPGTLPGSGAPLQRTTAGRPFQGAVAMQSASMLRPSFPPGLGSRTPGSHGMSSAAPIMGAGLPSMPGHGTAQPPQWSGAAGGHGDTIPPPSDNRQYSSAPSHPSSAHAAGQGQQVNAVQPHRAAMMPPALHNAGQPPVSASPGNLVRLPASSNGPPGLSSHAGVPAHGSAAQQGAPQHGLGASQLPRAVDGHDSRVQHPQKAMQQPQSAPGQMHETEHSHMRRSAKHSDSSLLEVQAPSSGSTPPGMNGHHNSSHPRNIPNGVYERGTSRQGVSKEREHARPEHGHAASKGRPPEVEAGYS